MVKSLSVFALILLLVGCGSAPVVQTTASVAAMQSEPEISYVPERKVTAMAPKPPAAKSAPKSIAGDGFLVGQYMSNATASTYKAPPPSASLHMEGKVAIKPRQVPETKALDKPTADDILNQLQQATIAFAIPESANISDRFAVELVIDMKLPEQALVQVLDAHGIKYSASIAVSNVVTAKLTAPTFEIVSLSPERQPISQQATTSWRWELTPSKTGKQDVFLSVNSTVTVGSERVERSIKTFEKAIQIDITRQQQVKQWLTQNWQWLWTTLILPFGMWLYKKKKPPEEAAC